MTSPTAVLPVAPITHGTSRFLARRNPPARRSRPLTASAAVLDLQSKTVGPRLAKLRATWQGDAWSYRDEVGEVRFGVTYLANIARRMRLYPAIAAPEGGDPIPIDDAEGVSAQFAADCREQVDRLAAGRVHAGEILGPLIEQLEVPGEGMLVGRALEDGSERWAFHSADELKYTDHGWVLLGAPNDRDGVLLDDETSLVSRVWRPHPRWAQYADSPMRTLLDVCEEILVTGRAIRALLRSRISAGILFVHDDLTFPKADRADGAEGDDDDDDLLVALGRAMSAAVADEANPAALVPFLLRGAPTLPLDQVLRHIELTRQVDPELIGRQDKAIRRLALGMNVPPEVILGVAEVNHWTAWQVDEGTFTHHAEPVVQTGVDGLTVGMFRPALLALGHPAELVSRALVWYDPTEVVTKPNRVEDAGKAHDRLTISDDAYRREVGFGDDDAPDEAEIIRRAAMERGNISDPLVQAVLAAIMQLPQVVDAIPAAPSTAAPADGQDDAEEEEGSGEGPPPAGEPETAAVLVAAAGDPRTERLSRRLTTVDRDLRARVHTAADDVLHRAVERAGNRIRSAANRDDGLRASLSGVPAGLVAATVGRDAVTAGLGLDARQLLEDTIGGLRDRWTRWTATAAEEAIDVAADLARLDRTAGAVARQVAVLRDTFAASAEEGWRWLSARLVELAEAVLYDPAVHDPEQGEVSDAAVPVSVARAAVSIAGGRMAGVGTDGLPSVPGRPLGGIGTGDTLAVFLTAAGQQVDEYEWVYGVSSRPFEPHRAMDGRRFDGWADAAVLAPPAGSEWLGPIMAPGDHRGCGCDYAIIWADGQSSADAIDRAIAESTDPRVLAELRATALADIAAGRYDTDAVRTSVEAERIANARPSRLPTSTPVTDALRAAGRLPR